LIMTEFLRTENRFISHQKSHKMVYYKNINSHVKIEDHDWVQFFEYRMFAGVVYEALVYKSVRL